METLLSWIIGIGNPTSAFLTGRGRIEGWVVLIAAQVAYVPYTLLTHHEGFWLLCGSMILMATYQLYRWSRPGFVRPGSGRVRYSARQYVVVADAIHEAARAFPVKRLLRPDAADEYYAALARAALVALAGSTKKVTGVET